MKIRTRLFAIAATALASAAALGQVSPAGEPRGPRPPERAHPPERTNPEHRPVDPRRPDAPNAFRPAQQVDVMRGYLDLVERYTRLSRDPAAGGIAAVVATRDILMPRGPQAVIEHFDK